MYYGFGKRARDRLATVWYRVRARFLSNERVILLGNYRSAKFANVRVSKRTHAKLSLLSVRSGKSIKEIADAAVDAAYAKHPEMPTDDAIERLLKARAGE